LNSQRWNFKNIAHYHKGSRNSLRGSAINRISRHSSRHLPRAGPSSLLPISSSRRQPAIPDARKESRHPAEDQRHVALTRNIPYLIWGCSRPFFSRSFSTIGFSLDLAFISRAETEQSRLSSNSASLTHRDGAAACRQTFWTIARDVRSTLRRGAERIDRMDQREDTGQRSIARERKAWVRNAVVCTRHCRLYPQLCRYSASTLRGGRSCATVCDFVHVHPHYHVTRGRVTARGGTGWTGRDGEKDRNGHVESAEVRQKQRDSVKETERQRETRMDKRDCGGCAEEERQRVYVYAR